MVANSVFEKSDRNEALAAEDWKMWMKHKEEVRMRLEAEENTKPTVDTGSTPKKPLPLLLEAKSTSSNSWVTVEMGEIHFLDGDKCAVLIRSHFFTQDRGIRCTHLKLEYSFIREDDTRHPNIELFKPRNAFGDDTPVTVQEEAMLSVKDPHTGAGGSAKRAKEWIEKRKFEISGKDFGNGQGGPRTKVIWKLSENPADKQGIPVDFQGVVVLNSTAPFMLRIKICADLAGTLKEYFTHHGGVEEQFYIDPETWKAAKSRYTKSADFDTWTGCIINDSVRWTGYPK